MLHTLAIGMNKIKVAFTEKGRTQVTKSQVIEDEDIDGFPCLQELSVSYCGLESLTPKIVTLRNLKRLLLQYSFSCSYQAPRLFIHNNRLKDVPDSLAALPHLKTIQMHNNPFSSKDFLGFTSPCFAEALTF